MKSQKRRLPLRLDGPGLSPGWHRISLGDPFQLPAHVRRHGRNHAPVPVHASPPPGVLGPVRVLLAPRQPVQADVALCAERPEEAPHEPLQRRVHRRVEPRVAGEVEAAAPAQHREDAHLRALPQRRDGEQVPRLEPEGRHHLEGAPAGEGVPGDDLLVSGAVHDGGDGLAEDGLSRVSMDVDEWTCLFREESVPGLCGQT